MVKHKIFELTVNGKIAVFILYNSINIASMDKILEANFMFENWNGFDLLHKTTYTNSKDNSFKYLARESYIIEIWE